jgi:Protein NO VEIN, C-terminal
MIVPLGLLRRLSGAAEAAPTTFAIDTERSERMAMEAVMPAERRLAFAPRDISDQNLGYDIESSIPGTGLLRFLEVKGRVTGAKTVTVTKNEVLTALNKPDEFILAVVIIDQDSTGVRYCRSPFEKEPEFKATSVNYDLIKLLAQSREPS